MTPPIETSVHELGFKRVVVRILIGGRHRLGHDLDPERLELHRGVLPARREHERPSLRDPVVERLPLRPVRVACRSEHDEGVGIFVVGDERVRASRNFGEELLCDEKESLLTRRVLAEGVERRAHIGRRDEPVTDEDKRYDCRAPKSIDHAAFHAGPVPTVPSSGGPDTPKLSRYASEHARKPAELTVRRPK